MKHPKLWWPNGYGDATLHTLRLAFTTAQGVSDETSLRFGVREITLELSAFDGAGRLRRVENDPAQAGGRRLKVKRAAPQIVDSIVAEDIGKPPDATIADSLVRRWSSRPLQVCA